MADFPAKISPAGPILGGTDFGVTVQLSLDSGKIEIARGDGFKSHLGIIIKWCPYLLGCSNFIGPLLSVYTVR